MAVSSLDVYEEFMSFCCISLKGEDPKFLDLIKSRYEGCSIDYRNSEEIVQLLKKTQKKMKNEAFRKFVHLKDLLTKLKIHATRKNVSKKRKQFSDLEQCSASYPKIPKFQDCCVVVEKFPIENASHPEQNMEVLAQPTIPTRRSCTVTDGNFNSSSIIVPANCDQVEKLREELGTGLESIMRSPSQNAELISPKSAHNITDTRDADHQKDAAISDSDSSLHISNYFSNAPDGKSPRKSGSFVDIDGNIAKYMTCSSTVAPKACNQIISVSHIKLEDRCDEKSICKNDNAELETSKAESLTNSLSCNIESPRRKSAFIVDVKLSNSPDILIKSASTIRHFEECSNNTSNYDKAGRVYSLNMNFEQSPALELKRAHVRSDDQDVLASTRGGPENEVAAEFVSCSVTSTILKKTLETVRSSSQLDNISVPLTIMGSKHKKTLEIKEQSKHLDSDLMTNCKSKLFEVIETVSGNLDIMKNQDLPKGLSDNIVYNTKPAKRVPLLSSTVNDDLITSGRLIRVSSFLKGSHDKSAQKPKSFITEIRSDSLEKDPAQEYGASADEFQREDKEHNSNLDARHCRQVIKLERLLASIRDEIEKCQQMELTLEDMDREDAAYIYEDKLKRKFVAAWNKLCEITGRSVSTGRPTERTIRYSGTRYREINRRIEKFLNKKKTFPDFHDVKSIVNLTNKKCQLNMSTMMVNDVAREAFVDIGEMLQRRRHLDFIANLGTKETDVLRGNVDPYLTDSDLKKKVDNNRVVARSNLDSVIAKYASLQYEHNEDCKTSDENKKDNIVNSCKDVCKKTTNDETETEKCVVDIVDNNDDWIGTASIEVDMAEESNDVTDFNVSDTHCSWQHPSPPGIDPWIQCQDNFPTGDSISGLAQCQLTPEKDKSSVFGNSFLTYCQNTSEKPYMHQDKKETETRPVSEHETKSSYLHNIIVVNESPPKSHLEPFVNKLFNLNKECHYKDLQNRDLSKSNKYESSKENPAAEFMTDSQRKGPNIKYTSRKPLPLSNEFMQNIKRRDDYEMSVYSCGKEMPANVLSKINRIDEGIDDDDDDDDLSSDFTSEKDDDKNVDDDVEEIVMIMTQSESEQDSESSRETSPVSVVLLSSDSEDGMLDSENNEKQPEKSTSTTNKQSGPTHLQPDSQKIISEKDLFLHSLALSKLEMVDAFKDIDLVNEKNYIEKGDGQITEQISFPQTDNVQAVDNLSEFQPGKCSVMEEKCVGVDRIECESVETCIRLDIASKAVVITEASENFECTCLDKDVDIVEETVACKTKAFLQKTGEQNSQIILEASSGVDQSEVVIIRDNFVGKSFEMTDKNEGEICMLQGNINNIEQEENCNKTVTQTFTVSNIEGDASVNIYIIDENSESSKEDKICSESSSQVASDKCQAKSYDMDSEKFPECTSKRAEPSLKMSLFAAERNIDNSSETLESENSDKCNMAINDTFSTGAGFQSKVVCPVPEIRLTSPGQHEQVIITNNEIRLNFIHTKDDKDCFIAEKSQPLLECPRTVFNKNEQRLSKDKHNTLSPVFFSEFKESHSHSLSDNIGCKNGRVDDLEHCNRESGQHLPEFMRETGRKYDSKLYKSITTNCAETGSQIGLICSDTKILAAENLENNCETASIVVLEMNKRDDSINEENKGNKNETDRNVSEQIVHNLEEDLNSTEKQNVTSHSLVQEPLKIVMQFDTIQTAPTLADKGNEMRSRSNGNQVSAGNEQKSRSASHTPNSIDANEHKQKESTCERVNRTTENTVSSVVTRRLCYTSGFTEESTNLQDFVHNIGEILKGNLLENTKDIGIATSNCCDHRQSQVDSACNISEIKRSLPEGGPSRIKVVTPDDTIANVDDKGITEVKAVRSKQTVSSERFGNDESIVISDMVVDDETSNFKIVDDKVVIYVEETNNDTHVNNSCIMIEDNEINGTVESECQEINYTPGADVDFAVAEISDDRKPLCSELLTNKASEQRSENVIVDAEVTLKNVGSVPESNTTFAKTALKVRCGDHAVAICCNEQDAVANNVVGKDVLQNKTLQECNWEEDIEVDESVALLDETSIDSDGHNLVDVASLEEEDDIKIIEELSSAKRIRYSDRTKAGDRKMVNQFLLNIDHNSHKGGNLNQMTMGCQGKGADIVESCEASSTIKSKQTENNECLLKTSNSYIQECEEVNASGDKVSSLGVAALYSQAVSPIHFKEIVRSKNKRTDGKSYQSTLSKKSNEADLKDELSGERETASPSIIEAEMLIQPKKQKVMKNDLITDIISDVLSEFPASKKINQLSSNITNHIPRKTEKTNSHTTLSSDHLDDEVVILEDTPTNIPFPVVSVALHKNETHTHETSAFDKESASSTNLALGKSPAVNKHQYKKTLPQAYLSLYRGSPLQRQSLVQSSSVHNSNISPASTAQSPTSVKRKYPALMGSSKAKSRIMPLGQVSGSPSLPRLTPRVPIPSLHPTRANELKNVQKHQTSGTTFCRSIRQSQFSASCAFDSVPVGNSATSARSVLLNRSLAPGVPLVTKGKIEDFGKTCLDPKSVLAHKPERHRSHSLSTPHISQHSMSTSRDKVIHKRNIDGIKIVLGDSDEEGECYRNISSGPKIVSVSSLSKAHNSSPHCNNNKTVKQIHCRMHKKNGDVIVIPD